MARLRVFVPAKRSFGDNLPMALDTWRSKSTLSDAASPSWAKGNRHRRIKSAKFVSVFVNFIVAKSRHIPGICKNALKNIKSHFHTKIKEVRRTSSPPALSSRGGYVFSVITPVRKRQRTGAVQDASRRTGLSELATAFGLRESSGALALN